MVNEKNGEESQEEESIDSELEAEVEEPPDGWWEDPKS